MYFLLGKINFRKTTHDLNRVLFSILCNNQIPIMKKILIAGSIAITLLFVAVYICLKSDYNKRLMTLQYGESIGCWQLESVLNGFYVRRGEFPVGIIHDDWDSDSLLQHNLVSIPLLLLDEFIINSKKFTEYDIEKDEKTGNFTINDKNVEELAYYPIYNRNNGKRESFVLLSAGIDGKLNNAISDTLYMDTWWTQLHIYNLREVMASVFYKQAFNILYVRTQREGKYIGGNTNGYTQQYMKSVSPKFSIFQYFFGKKDYVVRYGLPYYIYSPSKGDDKEMYSINMTWILKPELYN